MAFITQAFFSRKIYNTGCHPLSKGHGPAITWFWKPNILHWFWASNLSSTKSKRYVLGEYILNLTFALTLFILFFLLRFSCLPNHLGDTLDINHLISSLRKDINNQVKQASYLIPWVNFHISQIKTFELIRHSGPPRSTVVLVGQVAHCTILEDANHFHIVYVYISNDRLLGRISKLSGVNGGFF